MIQQRVPTIDYYVWLLSDWAYLGGVRFVQLTTRHGLKINHIPMRMQDIYAGSGGVLAAGVFGSPFYAFAGELFWGQDRLDMLEEAIVRSASGNFGRGPG